MSEAFSATWLGLREPADHRARAHDLLAPLRAEATRRGWSRALDLGAGTGSNLRYLSPHLPMLQEWTLFDRDGDLLGVAEAPGPDREVYTIRGDLAREGLPLVDAADLVTASALLDLVSDQWLGELVRRCVARGAGALFALSYDGRIEWSPPDPDDERITRALNAHQLGDKGLGPALGPAAAESVGRRFEAAGYRVESRSTPWTLTGTEDAELTLALLTGWVEAASEIRPDEIDAIRAWGERRAAGVRQAGPGAGYRLEVGHRDVLALPPVDTGASG